MILILSRRRIPASQAGIRLRLMNRNTQYPDIWAKKTRYDSGFFCMETLNNFKSFQSVNIGDLIEKVEFDH